MVEYIVFTRMTGKNLDKAMLGKTFWLFELKHAAWNLS